MQLPQQLIVGLVLLEGGDEGFHRFYGIEVHHGAAQPLVAGLAMKFGVPEQVDGDLRQSRRMGNEGDRQRLDQEER